MGLSQNPNFEMELCSYWVKLQHKSHYIDLTAKYNNNSLPINKEGRPKKLLGRPH